MAQVETAQRTKEHLPSVLLTLLSIFQAIALELVWAFVSESDGLYSASFVNALVWIQISATLLGILLVWLTYTALIMRITWVPSTSDFCMPFFIGLVEFALVSMLGVEGLGAWFVMLAISFGMTQWVVQHCMRRARLDAENESFFAGLPPAKTRDHLPSIVTVAAFFGIGVFLEQSGDQGVRALVALSLASGILGHQLYLADYYWKRSIGEQGS